MSYLEVVLKMMLLNLSLTVNMFFFSFTISTSEFSNGMKETFFSVSESGTCLFEFVESKIVVVQFQLALLETVLRLIVLIQSTGADEL